MTVAVVFDFFGVVSREESFEVRTEAEYVRACELIGRAIGDQSELRVVVTNPAMRGWFDRFEGNGATLERIDPRELLARSLGVSASALPVAVRQDPGVVVSQGLLAKADQSKLLPGEGIESWILRVALGPIWGNSTIRDASLLGELLRELVSHPQAAVHPTVMALRLDRVRQWESTSGELSPVVSWLFSGDSSRRASTALLHGLLRGYPEAIVQRALQFENRHFELVQLGPNVKLLELVPVESANGIALPPAVGQVLREHLSEVLGSSGLPGAAPLLTGQLDDECNALRLFIEQQVDCIDRSWADDLMHLQLLYAGGSPVARAFSNFAARRVPPPPPSPLPQRADWDQVSLWFRGEYQPFYRWCTLVGHVERTAEAVAQFETWLLAAHTDLMWGQAFAPHLVRDLLASLHERALAAVLIIVDGMPWEYAELLRRKLVDGECTGLDLEACVTTIPSSTFVAKPSLVRGQLPGQLLEGPEKNQAYDQFLASSLGLSPTDVLSGWSDDVDLAKMVVDKRRVYLYMANDIDDLIHHKGSANKRRQKISDYVENLAGDILAARQGFASLHGQPLAIVIASDHGFTELPSDCDVVSYSERPGDRISHCRLVRCATSVVAGVDGLVPIGPEILGGIDVSFLVAGGYHCIKSRPKGATHGGLTPQEMVVPVLTIGVQPDIEPQEIEIAVSGSVRRGKHDNSVTVSVVNSNPVRAVVTRLSIRLVSLGLSLPLELPANSSVELDGRLDAGSVREKTLEIAMSATVDYLGDVRQTDRVQSIATTGAALPDQSFEDSFDL